ncbi:MAG: dihydroorotase [Pedobacter sp.]|nr:dihydroorotase [Chitinophagaceae bacterium]
MRLLLQKVLIADINSPFKGTIKDILIIDGIIAQIADNIASDAADTTIIHNENYIVSTGWVDIFSHFCDPGLEHRETLASGAATAAAGGFTQVFILPNTQPGITSKTQVEYVVEKSKILPITIQPLGAVTKQIEGKELAEMYDMTNSGAVAFSDGLNPIQSSGLLLKALQYIKAFNGVIIQVPNDKSISAFGLINEGITSTQLGLPGIPTLAEELMVARDIELLKYTESKLHITGISTAKSVALIEQAKADGLQITCSVTPYHLFFCDEDLADYDTNLKTNPPLRSRTDMMALRQAVVDGKIDCIASHHLPQNWDSKTCEFEYAKYGMIGLQTSYAIINQLLPQLSNQQLVNLFSNNARNIFGLQPSSIAEGAVAELTLFKRDDTTLLTKNTNKSRSANSPLFNQPLQGKVIGIIHKSQLHLNK